jgi:hypothetical protein
MSFARSSFVFSAPHQPLAALPYALAVDCNPIYREPAPDRCIVKHVEGHSMKG